MAEAINDTNQHQHRQHQHQEQQNTNYRNYNRNRNFNRNQNRQNFYHHNNYRNNNRYWRRYEEDSYQSWHTTDQHEQQHQQLQRTENTRQSTVKQQESRIDILTDQLLKNKCECMICCYIIRQDVAVWSCNKCSHIYHLFCVKKWAKSSAEQNTTKWRCPACQATHELIPNKYTCFCTKQTNPVISHKGQIPHTCGEVCGKFRDNCPHKCNLLCHPGPCPTCDLIVSKQCGCGKLKFQVKCSSTKVPQCNNVCEKLLNCGKHFCAKKCHSSDCGECNEVIEQHCYSHRKSRIISCTSNVTSNTYSCGVICDRLLDCKNHRCTQICHEGPCTPCEFTPERLKYCACGKTQVKSLITGSERKSCLDPVPVCQKKCEKVLSCSTGDEIHLCQSKCHTGICSPCDKIVTVNCRCGIESEELRCIDAQRYKKDPKKCDRKCNKKKTCGRHKCAEVCCDFTDHICTIICGRKLNCGQHQCESLCHRGNCPNCQVNSFDELTCECGQTIVYPPVRCGTRLPECKNTCQRRHVCDHEVKHNCHQETQCPPCTFLTEKQCMGGHEVRRNIPCFMSDVSCGRPCGKDLPCGMHKCIKICHKGSCLNEGETCNQSCTKERPFCGHLCSVPCHGIESKCPDSVCQSYFKAKCKCGLKTENIKCGHRTYAEISSVIYENLGDELEKMLNENRIDLTTFEKSEYLRKRQEILCDEECQLAERNRQFALALEIDPTKAPKPIYSDFLKQLARDDPKFVLNIEKIFEQLIQDLSNSKQTKKTLTMIQLRPTERRFIHEYGSYYSFETQTTKDEYNEANKVVTIVACKGKAAIPNETLSDSMDIKPKQNLMPHVSTIKSSINKIQNQMQTLKVNPIDIQKSSFSILESLNNNDDAIDYFDFTD